MKSLHLFCILGAFAAAMGLEMPDELKEMGQMVHDQCVEESGTTDAAIEGTKSGNFPAGDEKLKCYLKCLYSNMGALSDEGELDAEAFSSVLPDSLAGALVPMIEKCKGVTGSDACDLAFNFNVCLYNADPANYLII